MGYIDLTGCLPFHSIKGNRYHLVASHFDENAIYAEPIKNRVLNSIIAVWEVINKRFEHVGVQPNTYTIDNEAFYN